MTSVDLTGIPTQNRVALGVSGGIAAYKAVEILRGLQRAGCSVRVAMTQRACEFVRPLTFRALSGSHVVVDDYAPDNPDPIAHITFSQTVDLLLVAPATANIIAKFAHGIADDFLTSTYLACTSPILVAPAMNTTMWEHPATQRNVERLRKDGIYFVEPDAGEMACGTIGPGRLSDPERVVSAALEILRNNKRKDLAGERLLITVGATREEIDPVRFISNRSSGKMGFAIVEAARRRGATVTAIAGATTVDSPPGVDTIRVNSAMEMAEAVRREIANATIFIGAAAVADYRPAERANQKIKKNTESLTINLERTEDILSAVAANRHEGMLVVGFAAESENLLENARNKLRTKQVDVIVANDISERNVGFDFDTNAVTILSRNNYNHVQLPLMTKQEIADQILDVIVKLRSETATTKASST
ncbi:MAG TPA: bifunctional phosphopantothenoylcysteine decarboxylase/phosphopantothenate--cysteine ligase CoaBC [Pyrinomonadaceae bacterium]|jgi:phosphopantothenoylcysteine decarboxylase/phosphopantothenate--cysteine ligase|nr:bifunctional phosphopantothenoylcysteine decarboxylase/phosphopantothenate--cysteine ligase CoaBC [Pyrinomonadaceae bacterium]